ncbi:2-oxoacid:ferredoxin oxidoreductase subunit alpha [Stetteria hydrogenophila]
MLWQSVFFMEEARFLLGGPQGSGLEAAAQVLASAYAVRGYRVYSTREYHSNIIGRHSYILVRVSSRRQLWAPRESPHIIAALDAETVLTHFPEAVEGTLLIYDSGQAGVGVDKIHSMEPEAKLRVKGVLEEGGYPATVEGAASYARDVLGAKLLPLDFNGLLSSLSEKLGIPRARARRLTNTILVSAIALLTGLGLDELRVGFERRFRGRRGVVEANMALAGMVYEMLEGLKGSLRLDDPEDPPGEYFIASGNDVVAMGKVVGGLRFQAYYPITPAADESMTLEAHENLDAGEASLGGVVVFQTEDEIAAIASTIGAALAGARAATATSGPGFDLMAEGLSYAGMIEAPIVVTFYQRAGPSTGMATRGGQQDLYAALFSGHGEFPRIVLASGDHVEAFYDSVKALNWAERYQLPVIHLLDKFLANSIVTMEPPSLRGVRIDRGLLARDAGPGYERFDKRGGPVSPRAFIGQEGVVSWHTGNEHDERGHTTEDPVTRLNMHRARMEKLRLADSEIPEEGERAALYGDGGDFLLVGWGSVKGAALEALELLKGEGLRGSYLHLRVFNPFPSRYVLEVLKSFPEDRVIAVEANYLAQAAGLVAMNTGYRIGRRIVKWTGRPVYVEELARAVVRIVEDGSVEEVLEYGA